MPRAKKVSPALANTAPEVEKSKVRKGKRPAEDAPEEVTIPLKTARTNVASRSKPLVNGENVSGTNTKKSKRTEVSEPETSSSSLSNCGATLHAFGTNDCGQLGFECEKRKYPAVVPFLKDKKFVQVACGGMHTIALEINGTVWSFGLNDDKALGRHTEEEEDGFEPGQVQVPGKVVQISAGDSHSAALTEDGKVFAWGCFKDDNGNYGLIADGGEICRETPEEITAHLGVKFKKIASGAHHIVMISEDGFIYTCGTGTQGQLGRSASELEAESRMLTRSMSQRVNAQMPQDSSTAKKEFLLKPTMVRVGRKQKFRDVWTGDFSTYCLSDKGKDVFVFGLNNYSQLGIRTSPKKNIIPKPTKTNTFRGRMWKQIAPGFHHVVALDEQGKVYTLGRSVDGRLGLGEIPPNVEYYDEPQLVQGLADKVCVQVAAGASTSYAVTSDGHLFAWGFGDNFQLAAGDEEDRLVPTRCLGPGKTDIDGKVVTVDAGGQHVALTIALPTVMNGNS